MRFQRETSLFGTLLPIGFGASLQTAVATDRTETVMEVTDFTLSLRAVDSVATVMEVTDFTLSLRAVDSVATVMEVTDFSLSLRACS